RALFEAIQRAAIAKKWNKSQQKDREEEAFWEGLSKKTRLEMACPSQSGSACITEYISKIEEKIIQETTLERLEPRTNKRIMTATAQATNPMMKGKWCNMHKTSAHDNTECFMQKKRNAAKKRPIIKLFITTVRVKSLRHPLFRGFGC
ncbi:hypothetical protein ENBRE01_3499, partial [Enteropsectra breve]